jgi:CHAT domain-containing protein
VEPGANVDGLPIAFLTAGARAVIGCQQEIETATSRYFFEQLYAALVGADDLRDAFRAAQTATRRQYPDPDRWAAFYLLGDWR